MNSYIHELDVVNLLYLPGGVIINNSSFYSTVSELRTNGSINPTNCFLYSTSFIWCESFSRRISPNQTYEYQKRNGAWVFACLTTTMFLASMH